MTAHIVHWQDVLDRMPTDRREATINRLADRLIDGAIKPPENIYYLDSRPGFLQGDDETIEYISPSAYVAPPSDCG